MFHLMILLSTLATITFGQSSQQNFNFVFLNRVYASYSTWIIDFRIDLNTMQSEMDDLNSAFANYTQEVQRVRVPIEQIGNMGKEHKAQANALQNDILQVLNRETLQMDYLLSRLQNSFDNLKTEVTISNSARSKRSLLPLGGFLSNLLGVADQDTVDKIASRMRTMQVTQGIMYHALQDGFSVLNTTTRNVASNRNSINALINSTGQLTTWVKSMYVSIVDNLTPQIDFVTNISKLHSMFNLIHSTFGMVQNSINQLQMQVIIALQQRLASSIITPDQLFDALQEVKRQLPSTLDLPEPLIKSDVRKYYQILRVTVVPDNMSFHLLVTLPLIQKSSIFELYKLVHVPAMVSHNQALSFLGLSEYFAISPDRNVYVKLDDSEVVFCIKPGLSFCKFRKPVLSTNFAPSCESSLFLHDSKLIKVSCQTSIGPIPKIPVVKALTPEKWLMFSPVDTTLDLVCLDPSLNLLNNIAIQKGINNITLVKGCSAHSSYFTLPFYLQELSNFNVRQVVGKKYNIAKFLYNISKQASRNSVKLTSPIILKLSTLSPIDPNNPKLNKAAGELEVVSELHPLLENPFRPQVHWVFYLIGSCLFLAVLFFLIYKLVKIIQKVKRVRKSLGRAGGTETPNIRRDSTYALVDRFRRKPKPQPRTIELSNFDPPPETPPPRRPYSQDGPTNYVRTVEILS